MMARLVPAALLALTAGSAVAQDIPAWAGYWALDPAWCARAGEPGEDTPEYIAPDGIFGLEYSCTFDDIAPIGVGQSWRADLTCLETGFEDRSSEIFVVTADDRLLRIFEDGHRVELHRCPTPVGG